MIHNLLLELVVLPNVLALALNQVNYISWMDYSLNQVNYIKWMDYSPSKS